MKIAIAQMNPVVGDIKKNADKALEACYRALAHQASLIIFPELFLCGYPPKDLLLRADFLAAVQKGLTQIALNTPLPVLMGAPSANEHSPMPYNAALLLNNKDITVVARKRLLPNYNVFDELRYFSTPQDKACDVFTLDGHRLMVSICEDAWNRGPDLPDRYSFDPVDLGFRYHKDIELFINISASPFSIDKPRLRERIFTRIAQDYAVPVLVCGQVGANDQTLFDGHSMIIDDAGTIVARAHSCEPDLLIYDSLQTKTTPPPPLKEPGALMRDALVMGLKDYVEKCGAPGLIVGLSGGIDSAVCASLAVLALGPERVKALYLPSKYSGEESQRDAYHMARNLGINCETIDIQPAVDSLSENLRPDFNKASAEHRDRAEQNVQARVRGLLLMGVANATDFLLMSTSNKSELATGYSTLYGDMCGALAPLGDIYKTDVWRLAHAINEKKAVIPEAIIKKVPTAELKPNQRDEDTLPPYLTLDAILKLYIDDEKSAEDIRRQTAFDITLINQTIRMVELSEYKRRQAPFALMVSEKVFGDARRLPIAKRWGY